LLLNANEVVSRDRIIDELWGERPPATAAKLVQVYVSALRKLLEPGRGSDPNSVLITRSPGYMLQADPSALDLHRLQRLLDDGRAALSGGAYGTAREYFRQALELWRGPPLADFAFAEFAQAAIARLEDLRLGALVDRIEADLALGRGDVVGELEALIAEHPLQERLRGQLMLALYRAGRQAEALAATRRRGAHSWTSSASSRAAHCASSSRRS
jgi:DNA-binding SARP family transcriptional activator